ncbi:hypothetical protein CYJ36_17635 [Bacillus sp. UMB0893]|nr:hypothetical protein CYJ36_17635 [Bacillus sp. UMB0893]
MYVGMTLFILGGLIACYVLITSGLKFESKYAVLYLAGGLLLSPFFIYETLWALPGFIPGKTFFVIHQGNQGEITSKKQSVPIKQIRNIEYKRNPINLLNEVIIETYQGKKIKLKTYNFVAEVQFFDHIDRYVFPYMTDEARIVWDRKISNNQLLKDINYERNQQ